MANATEFFDNLGKAISKTADIVAKKTDEFISVQKLRGRKDVYKRQACAPCTTWMGNQPR